MQYDNALSPRQETQKKIACPRSLYNNLKKKNTDLMSPAQGIYFLRDMFQITAIELVSVIYDNHINGVHQFWDTLNFRNNFGASLEDAYIAKTIQLLIVHYQFVRIKRLTKHLPTPDQ